MYYVFEGIDGVGKDTQADLLAARIGALRVNEPDETLPTGALLRQLLSEGSCKEAHAALFFADRLVLQEQKIKPHLDLGGDVVSSRSFVSSLVYQQDRWPLGWLMDMHRVLPCPPTHFILLDLDPEVALQRAIERSGGVLECYETLDTLSRNRQRYIDLLPHITTFLSGPQAIGVIDANGTPEEVEMRVQGWLS